MSKSIRKWSMSLVLDMLRRDKWFVKRKMLNDLTIAEYNAVGDWLYYKLNPSEKDCVVNRPVPQSIGTVFRRHESINWQEMMEPDKFKQGNIMED